MRYEIIETSPTGRRVILDHAETFAAAKAAVRAKGVVHMEDDADHLGCADALLNDGRLIAIQPEGFTL